MTSINILRYAELAKFAYQNDRPCYNKDTPTSWELVDNYESVIITFPTEVVVVIRGTEVSSLDDWFTNLRLSIFEKESGVVKIHTGFNSGARKLYGVLEKYVYTLGIKLNKQVTFVGHSSGGAIARVLGYLFGLNDYGLKSNVITFGCPKVGNQNFNNALKKVANVYHFTHKNDLVPYVPLFHGTQAGFIEHRICETEITMNPILFARLWCRIKAILRFEGLGIQNHYIDSYIDDLEILEDKTDGT